MRSLTALAILLFASISFAWWDSSFQYRAPVTVNSSFNLTDYSVQLNYTIYNETGLVGSWHFSSNDAYDSSGFADNGVINGGANCSATGKFGGGCRFDGSSGYVSVPDSAQLRPAKWTIGAWIYPTSTPSDMHFIVFKEQLGNGGPYNIRRYADGSIEAIVQYFSSPSWYYGSWKTAANTSPLNQWTRIDWIWGGNTGSSNDSALYVNGTSVNVTFTQNSYASVVLSYGALPLLIAKDDGGGRYFNGTLDEIRIYNRTLSAQEIFERYNATKVRPDYADIRLAYLNSSSSAEASVPFWQESDKSIWLKASLLSGSNAFYMYYGNSSAGSASNSSAVSPQGDLATSAQAISSGDYSIGPVGYKAGAFDNNLVSSQSVNTGWFSANTIDATGGAVWLGQNFTGGKTIKRYNVLVDIDPSCTTLSMCPVRVPYAWTFEGSNDAGFSTKTILDNQTGYTLSDSVWASFNVSSPAQYQYYRMRITKTGTGVSNNYAFVTEMEMIGFDPVSPAPTVTFGAVQQDNVAPVVSIQSPLNQTYSNSTVQVNFTALDNVAVSSCAVRLNGIINSSSCGNYSLALSNGAYVLNVTAYDATGNVNSTQVYFTIDVDAIPPSVSLQSPANITYNSTSIALNFTASDSSGISACKSELNGINASLANCTNTSLTAANGSNSLTVWASDGSNWGSASVSFTVSLPQAPPLNNTTNAVSNSTITGSDGIGNASLNGISSGASRLALTVSSQTQAKAFSLSSGVTSVRIYAKVTSKGTPVPSKTLSFEIS